MHVLRRKPTSQEDGVVVKVNGQSVLLPNNCTIVGTQGGRLLLTTEPGCNLFAVANLMKKTGAQMVSYEVAPSSSKEVAPQQTLHDNSGLTSANNTSLQRVSVPIQV